MQTLRANIQPLPGPEIARCMVKWWMKSEKVDTAGVRILEVEGKESDIGSERGRRPMRGD